MMYFSWTGRSPDLAQFVKHGKVNVESYVEVDLLRDNDVVRIRRTIFQENNTSTWLINRKKSREKEVKLIMIELSIDVDNLCSFMPQDKVYIIYILLFYFYFMFKTNNFLLNILGGSLH